MAVRKPKTFRSQVVASVAPPGMGRPAPPNMPSFVPAASNMPASPAPDPQALTPDAQYLSETAAYNRPYDTALARLPEDLQAGSADYGYGFSTDPNDPTKISVGGVDPSNPYSRAALLQRSYDATSRGNTTGMAARGQLYSGALQNAQNSAFTHFNQASAENRRGFEGLIRGFVGNLGQLGADRDINLAGALGGLTERRANDPNQPPSMYAGVPYEAPTAEQPFARPLGAPTAASVMASKSLLGTAWDRPIISRPYNPPKRPKRKP